MASKKKGYLKETVHYQDSKGTDYKYEIYHRADGASFYALMFRKEDIPGGNCIWVADEEFIYLPPDITHLQFAVDEITRQFNEKNS